MRARTLSLSLSLPLRGYWWLNLWSLSLFFLDSIWPVPPCTSSYSEVHRLAFSKGHVKVICFLFRGRVAPTLLGMRCISSVWLISYCNVSLWYLYRGTGWSWNLSWKPQKILMFDIFRERNFVLIECLEVEPDAPLLPSPLPLWYWLHSFSDIIKSHNPWLLRRKTFSEKVFDVSVWLYMIKYIT